MADYIPGQWGENVADDFVAKINDTESDIGGALRAAFGRSAELVLDDATDATLWATQTGSGTVTVSSDALAFTTTAQANYIARRDVPFAIPEGGALVLEIERDANLQSIQVFAYAGTFAAAVNFNKSIGVAQLGPAGKLYKLVLPAAAMTGSGTRTPADLMEGQQLRISVTPAASTNTTLKVRKISVVTPAKPAPRVCFQFDDGRADTYTVAAPILAANGYTGSIAVEHDAVGSAGRMTLAQYQELYADGWALLGHYSASMTAMSESAAVAVFKASRDWLHSNGFHRGAAHWVWPGGARSDNLYTWVRRYFRTARGTGSPLNVAVPGFYEPYEPSIRYVVSSSSVAGLKTDVLDLVAAYGGTAVLVFHSVTDSPAAEDITVANFTEIVEYCASIGLTSATYDEVFGGPTPE